MRFLPAAQWIKQYHRELLVHDGIAAVIVTVLLIPQSLAYAMLAGLPPEMGLYASILPLIAYALFGSSRTLSVGPVAVVSLLSASAVGAAVEQGVSDQYTAAVTLALLSGGFLLAMGLLRLGFMANFLSHSVISGFITASGILIALSQMKHILGIDAGGENIVAVGGALWRDLPQWNPATFTLGATVIMFLLTGKYFGRALFSYLGLRDPIASALVRSFPVLAVLATIAAAFGLDLERENVALVGTLPSSLPTIEAVLPSTAVVKALWLPALMISLIGYVESISVGMTLATKRRQVIDANQELVGLGVANLTSSISGGYPVTGGFSRSVVNFDAGAQTQMASILAALGIAIAVLFLTPALYYLPEATLAATIIVAVTSLIDVSIFKKTWRFSKSDFWAVSITVAITLLFGVETGVVSGVVASLWMFIYRSARPHIAEVGLLKGTQHFRNVDRHCVERRSNMVMLRLDESLFFANAQALKETIDVTLHRRATIRHVVLVCSAINSIDFSALEILEHINSSLAEQGVALHLAEVKGPVMDALAGTDLIRHLHGQVYLSLYDAYTHLGSEEV